MSWRHERNRCFPNTFLERWLMVSLHPQDAFPNRGGPLKEKMKEKQLEKRWFKKDGEVVSCHQSATQRKEEDTRDHHFLLNILHRPLFPRTQVSPCFSQHIVKSSRHHPKSRYHHVTFFSASVSLLRNVMFWCLLRAQGSWDGAMARSTLTQWRCAQRSSYLVHRCVALGPSKLGNFDFFCFFFVVCFVSLT